MNANEDDHVSEFVDLKARMRYAQKKKLHLAPIQNSSFNLMSWHQRIFITRLQLNMDVKIDPDI